MISKNLFKSSLLLSMLLLISKLQAMTPLTIGGLNQTQLNINTGSRSLLLGLDYTGAGTLTLTAASSNSGVLSVLGVSYTQGRKAAVVNVREFGTTGNVVLTVTGNDGSGAVNKTFNINVGVNFPRGTTFSVYDIVFWQNTMPVTESPLATTIIGIAGFPTVNGDQAGDPIINGLNFNDLPLTVGCPCTPPNGTVKGSFYTTAYTGVIIPTATGIYLFSFDYQDGGEFWLSNNASLPLTSGSAKARFKKATGDNNSSTISDTAWLVANRPYGFRASNWVVFSERYQLRMGYVGTTPSAITTVTALSLGLVQATTPGFNAATQGLSFAVTSAGVSATAIRNYGTVIGNPVLFNDYDIIPPSAPVNLSLVRKTNTSMDIKWTLPADFKTNPYLGYRLYINGVLNRTITNPRDSSARIFGLTPNTQYTLALTAYDASNNESVPSNILFESTFGTDVTAPTAPTLSLVEAGDMSAKVSWTGAADPETGIYGYKVYVSVNGGPSTAYNTDTANVTTKILKTYQPQSELVVQVEAYNGVGLVSPKSNALLINLLTFNPNLTSPGVKKARMNIENKFIGYNAGWGINAPWQDPGNYSGAQVDKTVEAKFQQVRWGTLDANPYRFDDKAGPLAKRYTNGNATTFVAQNPVVNGVSYARFVKHAQDLGIHASISIGTDSTPASDWRLDPEGTARLFVAYLNGTSIPGISTSELQIINRRLQEGYTQPMLPGLKGLIVELGNEPWGGTSLGAGVDHNSDRWGSVAGYVSYGVWCRRIANGMKSSPFYDSTKVKIFYSGRYPSLTASYGLHESMVTRVQREINDGILDKVDGISAAGYLGGNLNYDSDVPAGESEIDYYNDGLRIMSNYLKGFNETINMDFIRSRRKRPFYLYESNMTSPSYNKRVGQAIRMSDYFISSTQYGSILPCAFALEGGEWGLTEPGNGVKYPWFYMSKFMNTHAIGQLMKSSITSLEVIKAPNGSNIDIEPVSANLLYEEGGKYKLVLISRDFTNPHQVQISLPAGFPASQSAKMYKISGSDFSSFVATIDSGNVTISNRPILEVAPYTMYIYKFDGPVLSNKPVPLGYNAHRSPVSITYSDDLGGSDELLTPIIATFKATASNAGAIFRMDWKITKSSNDFQLVARYDFDSLTVQVPQCVEGDQFVTVTGTVVDEPEMPVFIKVLKVVALYDLFGDPCATSTKKALPSSALNVYPNPSQGTVTLEANLPGTYVINNMQGGIVKSGTISQSFGREQVSLEQGVYVITLTTKNGVATKKVVVTP